MSATAKLSTTGGLPEFIEDGTFKAAVTFSVKDGKPSVGSFEVSADDVAYNIDVSPVKVSGTASLTWPCSELKPVMLQGSARIALDDDDVTVNGDGSVQYDCMANTVTVNLKDTSITAGPVSIAGATADVVVDLKTKGYKGVVTGKVGLDFISEQVPALPASSADSEDLPDSKVVFSKDKGLESLIANVGFRVSTANDESHTKVTVAGIISVRYPCNYGETMPGAVNVSATLLNKLDIPEDNPIMGSVTYFCKASAGDAAFAISVATTDTVTVGGGDSEKNELKQFKLDATAYKTSDGFTLAGSIAGVGSVRKVDAAMSFMFDLRDGSWSATVAMSYKSDTLDATLYAKSGSACSADTGTSVGGTVKVTLPDEGGKLIAQLSGEKLCPTDETVSYEVYGYVDRAEITIDDVAVTLTAVEVTLKGTGSKDAEFGAMSWNGKVSGTAEITKTADINQPDFVGDATMTAAVTFSKKSNELPSVDSVVVNVAYNIDVSPVKVSGTASLT
jgi:hypothetical protein